MRKPASAFVPLALLTLTALVASAKESPPRFDSGILEQGEQWPHTFDAAGLYAYHCTPHPYMTGIIEVAQDAAESVNTTVEIRSFAYTPDTLRVRPGTVVTWRNSDATGHSVTHTPGAAEAPRGGVEYRDYVVLGVVGALAVMGLLALIRSRKKP